MSNPAIFHITQSIDEFTQLYAVPSNTPIHLTTSLPLPTKLSELRNLVYLHIEMGDEEDREFKDIICQLISLEILIIDRSIPFGFPDEFYNLVHLKKLVITNGWFWKRGFSESIQNFKKLEHLEYHGLYTAKVPDTIGQLTNLKTLIIEDKGSYLEGGSRIEVAEVIWNLVNLRELRIGPCTGELDASGIVNLTQLEVFQCDFNIKTIPKEFWENKNLRAVEVWVTEQDTLPSLGNTQLESLTLRMSNLQSIPELPGTLTKLGLSSHVLKAYPPLGSFQLEVLSLWGEHITQLPQLPNTLKTLILIDMENITTVSNLPSIDTLQIRGCGKLRNLQDLPETLNYLRIDWCSTLTGLPPLTSLDYLVLRHCKQLETLPGNLIVGGLIIDFCKNLTTFPTDIQVLERVQLMGVDIVNLPEFPEHVVIDIRDDY